MKYHRLAVCVDWLCLTDHYGVSLKCTHQHSGRYTRSVGGTLRQCSYELSPGSRRRTAEVAFHDSEDLFRVVPGTPNLQWGRYILFDRCSTSAQVTRPALSEILGRAARNCSILIALSAILGTDTISDSFKSS